MGSESDTIQLNGIQHFAFCRRQWALITVEQQWKENAHTAEGHIFHRRTDDHEIKELRGNILTVRALHIHSDKLRMDGICDVVEFHREQEGIKLSGREGKWKPYPVEYKKGHPKETDIDILQLCAQAICLEEMFECSVEEGSLYYGETRHRIKIPMTDDIRNRVMELTDEMHDYLRRGYVPAPQRTKQCGACSLIDICLPSIPELKSVNSYITSHESGGSE